MDKKYELVNVSTDNYILKYKDKSFEFKTDVSLVSEMQGIYKTARVKMIMDLSKDGMKLDNLIIKEEKNGKKYEDHSNREALENIYVESAMNDFFDSICKDKFGMSLAELLIDIGIVEDTKEVEKFAAELTAALTGSTPSGRK